MTLVESVNKILALGTIAAQIFIVFCLVYFVAYRKTRNAFTAFLGTHGLVLAFLTSLVAVASSLFYSQVAGFPPCDLCWFQRIFMYPQVILLRIAWYKKDANIVLYAMWLAVIGFFISLYHNYIYYFNQGLGAYYQLGGVQISCVKRYVFEFGYVTIPMMALTGFILVIIFLSFYKAHHKNG